MSDPGLRVSIIKQTPPLYRLSVSIWCAHHQGVFLYLELTISFDQSGYAVFFSNISLGGFAAYKIFCFSLSLMRA